MKILPDYIINFMPEIEAVLEELRLSVLDHAYELLKCLDVDELSSDDIKEKLRLYDLKVENMTDAWLPNGRFYRLYPSIKHHRTRQNTLKSIAQSGGQFEGLWSDEFMNKPQYNYRYIQILRHYQLGSAADGYFYVSGDTSRDKNGNITSSAVTALSSDILMGQALPAGYTYLYVPWPRPHFPFDAGYFYNVHMLDYDRLAYTENCMDIPYVDNQPELSGLPASMRYHWNNGSDTPYRTPYWFDYHYMDDMRPEDPNNHRHAKDEYGKLLIDTDDHYIETENFWPIRESGIYWEDSTKESRINESELNGKPLFRGYYELGENCKPLANSSAVLATKCYGKYKFKTSDPNRTQEFTPYDYVKYYRVLLTGYNHIATEHLKFVLANELDFTETETDQMLTYIDLYHKPVTLVDRAEYTRAHDLRFYIESDGGYVTLEPVEFKGVCLESYDSDKYSLLLETLQDLLHISSGDAKQYIANSPSILPINEDDENYEDIKSAIEEAGGVIDIEPRKIIHCIDEFYRLEDPQELGVPNGPYKWDHLSRDYILKLRDALHHIKTYRPFWDVPSPIFAMLQADGAQHYNNFKVTVNSIDNNYYSDVMNCIMSFTGFRNNTIDDMVSSLPATFFGSYTLERAKYIKNSLAQFNTDVTFTPDSSRTYTNNISKVILTGFETTSVFCEEEITRALQQIYSIPRSEARSMINSIPVELPINDDYDTDSLVKTIEEKCGIIEIVEGNTQTKSNHSLYHWMNLKQTENRPSYPFDESGWYDLNVNPTSYVLTLSDSLVDDLAPMYVTTSWLALRMAVRAVFNNVDIVDYADNPIIKIAVSNDRQFLENSIDRIHAELNRILSESPAWTGPSFWKYIYFRVEPAIKPSGIVKYNDPPVSEVTFTSYDRPTLGHLESFPLLFTRAANDNQGDDILLSDTGVNLLYEYNRSISDSYNPVLEYNLVGFNSYSHDETTDISKAYFIGDPSSKEIGLTLNGTLDVAGNIPNSNLITNTTSKVHTLWFNSDKSNIVINKFYNKLYNSHGDDTFYLYSNNDVNLKYNILGVYTADGTVVECDNVTVKLYVEPVDGGYRYAVYALQITLSSDHSTPATAAYIEFTVEIVNESAPILDQVNVPMYQQSTNTTTTARYVAVDRAIDIGDGYIPLADVYNDGWIMMKYRETLYCGQTAVTVYYDDFTGTWPG